MTKYQVDLPYPKIKVKAKNLEYAKLLHDSYSGIVSEMTAVNQYAYHHLVCENINKKIADAMEGFSLIEMEHLELLGKTIVELGGNPVCWGNNGDINQYWNASYIKYSKDIKQLLIDNIKSEQDTIYQYKRHIYIIEDTYIQEILSRIVMDERLHLRILTELLNECL